MLIGVGSGGDIHREMELLAAAGLSPAEVLVAATRNNALALRQSDQLGSIEPGKLCRPAAGFCQSGRGCIRNLRAIHRVMLNGQWVEHGAVNCAANELPYNLVILYVALGGAVCESEILVVSLAAGLLGLAGCDIDDLDIGGSERSSQDFHYSYPMQPGGRLSVENFNGSVEISGWDQDTVDISGTKYARYAGIAGRAQDRSGAHRGFGLHTYGPAFGQARQHGSQVHHQGPQAHCPRIVSPAPTERFTRSISKGVPT